MVAKTYDRAFAAMIAHEGGARYTNIPEDAGGPTKFGVTQAALAAWLGRRASIDDVKALTLDAVKPIYRANYANVVRFDDLPAGLDYLVFDWAVNSGPRRAAKELQICLGVEADGYIGPKSIAAARAQCAAGAAALINRYVDRRVAFYRGLIAAKPNQRKFEKGWMRRAAESRALALKLAKEG